MRCAPRWHTQVPGEAEMVKANAGLVHYVIRNRFSWLPIEYDDAVQIGMIGLLNAIRTFDPSKGVKFSTWAVLKISKMLFYANQIQNFKKRRPPTQPISIDAPRSLYDARPTDIVDHSQDPEGDAIASIMFEQLLKQLDVKNRKIAKMLIGGKSQKEIACEMGLAQCTVSRRVKNLRKIYGRMNR